MSVKTYAMAIRDTIASEMRRDQRVFLMGEDVEKQGGIFGCTRDLYKEFGTERIRNTPISEAGFVGAGLGAACTGMRPIVELMYMDFAMVAMDQIVNQVAKTRYIFGGRAKIPLVIRGQQGIGRGNAATHSQSMETLFMYFPGLKVVCPSSPADAAGLLRTAIRDDNPVMFFEHKALYSTKGEVPDDDEFMIPFGKANVLREGKDVTIVADLLYVGRSMEAAAELEKRILRELRDLDMRHVQFSIAFTEKEPGADGCDSVRFLMSANTGENLKSIAKIASGGELARIMLALKNVLAEQEAVGTLVFDEVDTGVSGRAAQKVAEKMAQVSRQKQVLCVTHLPQLAAMADTHFSVSKGEKSGRTYTSVVRMNRAERCGELARLTGGSRLTDAMLQSAGELLDEAEAYKKGL